MNSVTVSGWLQTDPVCEHFGDVAVCELRLTVEWPGSAGRTGSVTVTCFGRLALTAAEQLAVGDHVGVTGWLRAKPVDPDDGRVRPRVDVVAERLDFLGRQHEPPVVAADAHLEAAYEDRYELDEAP